MSRTFSNFSDDKAKNALNALLLNVNSPQEYGVVMQDIGRQLGKIVSAAIPCDKKCLVVTTAEDADFLSKGVLESLKVNQKTFIAVFWNNYVSIPSVGNVAPVIHKYLQPAFESSEYMIVVKSIISTSCVVRTNILALIEKTNVIKIFVVAPVIFVGAQDSLKREFPREISDKFEFIYYAVDSEKDGGNVLPGIGGQIYDLLGIGAPPVQTAYFPELVREFIS